MRTTRAARSTPWIAVLSLAGMIAACAGRGGPGGTSDPLAGRTFLSDRVTEGGAPRALVDGTRIRLRFAGGQLTASAGCNTMGGAVEIRGDRLVVGDLATTEMGCEPRLHEQDQWLAGVLGAEPRYTLEENRLRLEAGDVAIDLVDRRVADPDRPLEGTQWKLDGIIEGDAVSSVPDQAGATLVFEGGRVAVSITGCNQGGATVGIGEGTIRVGPLVMTKMACGEPAASVEAAVTAVLEGRITYQVEAASLTLRHPGGRGLMLRSAP